MKSFIIFLSTLIFLINNQDKEQNQNKIVIPFQIIKDHMIASLITEEGTLNLVFDIASNLSMIDSSKAKELDFPFGYNKSIQYLFSNLKYNEKEELLPKIHWRLKDFEPESRRINFKIDGLLGAYSLIKTDNTEIDFKNKKIIIGADFDPFYNTQLYFDLSTANKESIESPSYYPKFASIVDTVHFDTICSKRVDLIIDTGCKYGFAFIGNDSLLIDSLLLYQDDYSLFNNTKKVGFTSAHMCKLSSNYYKAPLFFRPHYSEIMNNDFFGLIGIPLLKKIDKIYFDWSNKKIIFINESGS